MPVRPDCLVPVQGAVHCEERNQCIIELGWSFCELWVVCLTCEDGSRAGHSGAVGMRSLRDVEGSVGVGDAAVAAGGDEEGADVRRPRHPVHAPVHVVELDRVGDPGQRILLVSRMEVK